MFVVPKALHGWIARFPTKANSNKVCICLYIKDDSIKLSCQSADSFHCLWRGLPHAGAFSRPTFQRTGLCRMKSRGTAIWTNVPCTTAKTFRSWLKDWGWQETTPWTWKRNDITLCAPSHTEADSQCHHNRMSWHETRLRQRQTP
jgi:hypothetical protein